jgi:hypothetical protein
MSRATESDVTVHALNRTLKLESLISVRPHRLNPDEEGLLRPPTDPRNTVEESTS